LRSYKKIIAPLSVTLLIIIAGLAFLDLQPGFVGPPPILDPNFQLWVGNPGDRRLMLWELEYASGPMDNVSLHETAVDGKRATQLLITQSGIDGKPAYLYLKQTVDGPRLSGLLADDVGVWVRAEPCSCNSTWTSRSMIFGVEVNDGVHTITFIFSDHEIETRTLLAHRFVYLTTQPETWAYVHINITRQYTLAQWNLPDHLTFSLFFEAGTSATGLHSAYVNSFQVTKPKTQSGLSEFSNLEQSQISFTDVRCSASISSPKYRIWS
jgi:hypothetical protein